MNLQRCFDKDSDLVFSPRTRPLQPNVASFHGPVLTRAAAENVGIIGLLGITQTGHLGGSLLARSLPGPPVFISTDLLQHLVMSTLV